MININFDNPWLILIAIPLLAAVIIPFVLAIRKENKSVSVITSLVLHLVMVTLISLACAGASLTAVITKTEVYVLADTSYSSHLNLDLIDEKIKEVKKALPSNGKLGVVAFGRDVEVLTEMGEELASVKSAKVDQSATDIKGALEYASNLFSDGVIKKIVLITDGKQTDGDSVSNIVTAVENLYANQISIDAIYLDNNVTDNEYELQISEVNFTESVYLNDQSEAEVIVESSKDGVPSTITLYCNGEVYSEQTPVLDKGYNVVTFSLPTLEAGINDYKISVKIEDGEVQDVTKENNDYTFTQNVAGKKEVLLITSKTSDKEKAESLYGEVANLTAYVNDPDVPFTLESLINYDEIILSDVDVRNLNNVTAFMKNLDTVVSEYGKSLVTLGDNRIQNQTDDVLKNLQDMLPVKYGNSDQDPKLLCIVLDTSRSMENAYKLIMAKSAAIQMLELLNDHDFVTVIAFSGDIYPIQPNVQVGGNRASIAEVINSVPPTQGTFLGKAMQEAYNRITTSSIEDKQVMLITDGRTYTEEEDDPVKVAEDLFKVGITTSVINTTTVYHNEDADDSALVAVNTMKAIAEKGHGNYYFAKSENDLKSLILTDVANDVTETIIEGATPVKVRNLLDDVMDGVGTSINTVNGYVYSKAKASATTVMYTEFEKSEDNFVDVPIYAYWDYGKGRVSSFTSDFTSSWTGSWSAEDKDLFFSNVLKTNTPTEKVDYPFTLDVNYGGLTSEIILTPGTLMYGSKASVKVTLPNGNEEVKDFTFNSKEFVCKIDTVGTGKFKLEITYTYSGKDFIKTTYLDVPYTAEYNVFSVFDISDVHKIIRTRGNVYTISDSIELKNDEKDIATYTMYFTVPFMIVAVALFVVDVIIRKLKWVDIVNLFGNSDKKKQGGKK